MSEHRARLTAGELTCRASRPPTPNSAETTSMCQLAIQILRSPATIAWRSRPMLSRTGNDAWRAADPELRSAIVAAAERERGWLSRGRRQTRPSGRLARRSLQRAACCHGHVERGGRPRRVGPNARPIPHDRMRSRSCDRRTARAWSPRPQPAPPRLPARSPPGRAVVGPTPGRRPLRRARQSSRRRVARLRPERREGMGSSH